MWYCPHCNKFTRTIEPVILRRQCETRFNVKGVCADCKWSKSKYLTNSEVRQLPLYFNHIFEKTDFINYLHYNNRPVHLFPFLDPIMNSSSEVKDE
jgi:hypothetical protein